MSGIFNIRSTGPTGYTVWIANSAVVSSTYANNVRYIPMRHSQSDYVEFQFIAGNTGTLQLQAVYAMSSAESNNVRLRLDTLFLASASNPTTSATTGTAFTITPGNDTVIHTITSSNSSDFALSVTAGNIVYCILTRLGSDGADTHTGDLRLIEIKIA
jgi:hypothetical protein